MKKLVKFLLLSLLVLNMILSGVVQALTAEDLRSINNDTVWYDPAGGSAACSTASNADLPTDIISAIDGFKATYVSASQATNVPWELIAALHYRETRLSASGPNLFQITGYNGPVDLLNQATAAGNFLQQNSVPRNLSNHQAPLKQTGNDTEEIKDTLFSYNGRAQAYAQQAQQLGFDPTTQPYEGSPYVMNNYDAVHHNMGIITHDGGGIDGIDTRLGAYTLFAKLAGSSGPGCSAVIGNAIQTAINYAWPDHHEPNYFSLRPAYAAAISAAQARGEFVGGGDHPGIDCGGFVTRVMRDSGVDPEYNKYQSDTNAQQRYLDDHPEKYQKLANVISTADLQPGDIAINSNHTYIYVGSQSGFNGNSASSSFSTSGTSWRSPMADNAYGFSEFSWYRLKAGG